MFKNPLKYQQGGQLNQEQQQMLAAFIDWLPKRVKEFEGMQPEAIVQALDGMSKTPEGQRQVQAYVEQFQNEMNGIASHKLGGKIQDFICKHAKGGHVGCGCAKKGAEGMVIDEPEYTWGQYNRNDFLNSGENHIGWTKVITPDGRTGWARNYRRKFLGIPSRNLDQILVTPDLEDGKYRSVGRGLNGFFGNGQIDTVYRFRNPEDNTKNRRNVVDSSLEGVAPERKQQGGRVNSGYEGMEYVTTNENEPGLGTLYTGWTREYIPGTRDLARSDMYGGQPEGLKYTFRRLINDGTIRDQIVDRNPENVSSIPNTTERLIQGTDTLYWPNRESFFKALTSKGTFAEGRPDWITLDQERNKYNASKKEDGGKVEKAQEGATIEPYYNLNPINEWIKNKFNNNSTLYHLSQGFRNFKESAPGKVLSFFIPNPNSETGMLSAAAPIGKIKNVSYRIPTQKVLYEKEPLAKTIKEGVLPEYNIPKYNKLDYDIDKTFNTDNFINNIDLSNLIEKNTFSKRFIKYLKNDVLPHTDTDWLKYGLGSIGGATAEAALIKYMQNKENKQPSKNKK